LLVDLWPRAVVFLEACEICIEFDKEFGISEWCDCVFESEACWEKGAVLDFGSGGEESWMTSVSGLALVKIWGTS
jgi:hypothetical protein